MSFMTGLTTSQGQLPVPTSIGSQNYLSRVPSLPESIYGTSHLYPQTTSNSYYPVHQTSMQSDIRKVPSSLGQHYYVDQMMNPHPYGSMYPGFDMNSIRRKNATRETTGPLKSWLSQHKKNPYPTKGEKVMLAIATRMTLTQVSTWFANARRRMKKDNVGDYDEGDDLKDSEPETRNRSGSVSSRRSHTSNEADTSKELSDLSDIEDVSTKQQRPVKKCVQRLFSPDTTRFVPAIDPSSSPESLPETTNESNQAPAPLRLPPVTTMMPYRFTNMSSDLEKSDKPAPTQKSKIWSISEIIGSAACTIDNSSSLNYNYQPQQTEAEYYKQHYYSAVSESRYDYSDFQPLNTSDSGQSTESKDSYLYL